LHLIKLSTLEEALEHGRISSVPITSGIGSPTYMVGFKMYFCFVDFI